MPALTAASDLLPGSTVEGNGQRTDPEMVGTIGAAGYSGTGMLGLSAIGNFARRSNDELKLHFVDRISKRGIGVEEVHQLVGLGEPGLEALVRIYKQLDESDSMRRQIESYSLVRRRLGLN
jgi:hypothetical protein